MKKLIWALLLLIGPAAHSQTVSILSQGQLGVSCNAVTASTSTNPGLTGGCTSFNLLTSGGSLPGIYTWQVITTGSPSSISVTLVGSLDGVTWTTLDTNTSASSRTTSSTTAYRFLGCVPGTLSGGTSPTLTCQISVTGTPVVSGSGTVTSIATTSPIGGGTITTTGTLTCSTCTTNASALTNNAVVLGAGSQATQVSTGITTNGASELDLGLNGTASGVLGVNGSTSGKATLTAPAVAGTATNPIVSTNGLETPAQAASFCVGSTTNCFGGGASTSLTIQPNSSPAAIFIDQQTFLTQSTEFIHPVANNLLRVTTDFTTAANTNLQTITGLAWTAVSNRAGNYNFHCSFAYSQATGTAAVAFGIQVATNAPTNVMSTGKIYTAAGTVASGALTALATTTATAVVSGTPGATATILPADMDGTLELTAASNTVNFMVSTATSGDAVTVSRGSYCMIF